jgi:hypothetical protein
VSVRGGAAAAAHSRVNSLQRASQNMNAGRICELQQPNATLKSHTVNAGLACSQRFGPRDASKGGWNSGGLTALVLVVAGLVVRHE